MKRSAYDETQIPVAQIHRNIELALIHVTEDKLRLALLEHLSKVEKRKEWQVPLGILLAVITTFVSADFKKEALGLGSGTWQAIFVITLILSGIWLLSSLRGMHANISIDELVEVIKSDTKAKNVSDEQ